MTEGEHSIVVVYGGDENYEGFYNVTTFNVEVLASKFVNITVENSIISAVLIDSQGNPIVNATVTYKINGTETNVTTDNQGCFTIYDISNSLVEFGYGGNDFILPTDTSINIKGISKVRLSSQIIGEDFTQASCDYYEGERGRNFTVQLVDASGNVLKNKTVYIGYNGVTLVKTTDENGYANVQINLKNSGLYTFVAVFLGDDDYNASMGVYKVTITKKPITISASAKSFKATAKTKKFTVTLKTSKAADGKTYLASGKKVTLKINGKTYTAKTNDEGKATFSLKISKRGVFTSIIKFTGDVSYEAASKSVKITIK